MKEKKTTPLRQRMIEDMNIRGLCEKAHIRNVKHFASFLGRSPDTATPEDLRSYQLKMTEVGVTASTFNVRIISLRFFFGVTCGRAEMKRFMQFHRNPRKLPVVLSVEEVADLMAAVPGPGLKYRAELGISYGAGLRASEVCNMKVKDIDSDRMLIHVDDGKGGRDRKTVMTIAADPKRLGARVGMTSVLHTWGSALTHHPHVHMIVPGGGLSPDGARWVACHPGFFLHVRVLSRLFRRLFLEGLMELHRAGQLAFFGALAELANANTFTAWLAPFRKSEWVVYAKPPFGGPEAELAYLSRYTHRVAISNARLVSADADTVAFRWKDYRIKSGERQKLMRLATPEFIRRFLIHVLPDGFHRIRHYGMLASAARKANISRIRALLCVQRPEQLAVPEPQTETAPLTLREPCPCCGGPMRIIGIFRRGRKPMSCAPPRDQAA